MEGRPFPSAHREARDLANAAKFTLGPLNVDPSARRIKMGARSEMLEPKVMRVLVALGGDLGNVLSRDDLIEQCWDGTVVGNNSINRVIFRLRHALNELSDNAVRLETIPRVGFRLVVDEQASDPLLSVVRPVRAPIAQANTPTGRRYWSRRAMALGLVTAGSAAAIGTATWFQTRQHGPNSRAVELYRRGQAIQKDGVLETMGEAIESYKQAVAIDPGYADAWGALALSYRYPVVGPIERLGDPQEVRAAARRALALDPGNVDARLALIMLYPNYRRWQEWEAQLRAFLRDNPDSALGHNRLGWLLLTVGRIEDALKMAQRAIDIDPTQQIAWLDLAFTYYFAGRDNEGDVAFEEGRSRWPQAWPLYFDGYYFLVFSKRYNEALAYLRDTSRRPRILRRETVEEWLHEADAFASGHGRAELKNKIRTLPASLQIQAPWYWAPVLALLGLVDEMFALFEAFFFGGVVNGTRVDPPGPLDPRTANALFAPAVLSHRNDPRFASLLARTGLEDYWYKTGTQPDFRRG
jgi:DNA-binding winged helix-turn-helix (wHTH) protein/tetratricopeptide (TPR) repeat protein